MPHPLSSPSTRACSLAHLLITGRHAVSKRCPDDCVGPSLSAHSLICLPTCLLTVPLLLWRDICAEAAKLWKAVVYLGGAMGANAPGTTPLGAPQPASPHLFPLLLMKKRVGQNCAQSGCKLQFRDILGHLLPLLLYRRRGVTESSSMLEVLTPGVLLF